MTEDEELEAWRQTLAAIMSPDPDAFRQRLEELNPDMPIFRPGCTCDTYTGSERINGVKCCERCGGPL